MIQAEHHQRVGVGQHAFVDGELVARLVDALEDRHRVSGGVGGQLLELRSSFAASANCFDRATVRRVAVTFELIRRTMSNRSDTDATPHSGGCDAIVP